MLIDSIGIVLGLAGLFLLAEGWRECRQARRAGRLATQGVYAVMRHPQYSGALIAALGLALSQLPLFNAVLAVVPMALAAVWLAKREDRALFARFGESHRGYRIRVAACMPRRVRWRAALASMVNDS